MELRHLKTFQAVAEELHFSRAALKLHVAQPALSRTIADLEAEMGVRLIERNSRGVALTKSGSLFLNSVRQILEDTRQAVEAAQRHARGETGTLRIGFIGTLSYDLLPRILQKYRKCYPAVELILRELGPSQQRSEILARNLDCGFIGFNANGQDPDLEMMTVAEEPLMVALPANHRMANEVKIRLTALRDELFYLTARSNAPLFNPWLIGLCRKSGFEPRIERESDRSATVLCYVAAGFGVSLFPSQLAALATPGVRFLPLTGRLPHYQYKLAWRRADTSETLREFARVASQPKQFLDQ